MKTEIGGLYRHKKGSEYVVIAIATEESTLRRVVVYRELRGDMTWTRPVEEFEDGRFEGIQNYIS